MPLSQYKLYLQPELSINLSYDKAFVFKCIFSKLEDVIFQFQLAIHTGSFCRCVTNTSPDSVDNRWLYSRAWSRALLLCFLYNWMYLLEICILRSFGVCSYILCFFVSSFPSLSLSLYIYIYIYPFLPLFTLSLSLAFPLSLIWYTFRSLLKDKSWFFFMMLTSRKLCSRGCIMSSIYSNLGVQNMQDCTAFCAWLCYIQTHCIFQEATAG